MMTNNFSTMNLFTHHRGDGSTANGRNSASRRLGTKRADSQAVSVGPTIYHRHGTKIRPSKDIGIGDDDTLFTLVSGIIKFRRPDETRR